MWPEKHRGVYRIRDRVGGKIVTLLAGYPTKAAAANAIAALRADQLRGDFIDPRGGQLLLADWLDLWWPGYEGALKPSTRISAEGLVRRYIRSMLGPLPLEAIDRLTVQRWTADLRAGRTPYRRPLAAKTVRNAHGMLHTVLAGAVAQRLIRANPCHRSGLPELPHTEMRYLTQPDAERLLAALPEQWRPLVMLMLFTGLRWGEAIGLRVGRVDVLARKLTVVETLQELAGTAEIVSVTPKSRASRRTVTFPVRVADALVGLVATRERGELVFTAARGGAVRHRRFRPDVWLPATAAAGLCGLRMHDLRHTHAAWLISANVPILAISRRLGHASTTVTMDRYGHLLPEVDAGIMTALDDTLDLMEAGSSGGAGDHADHRATTQASEQPAGQDGSDPADLGI